VDDASQQEGSLLWASSVAALAVAATLHLGLHTLELLVGDGNAR
jgi:hypothetical protein